MNTNIKVLKNMAAQGDFIIRRIKEIPENVEPIVEEGKHFIIAHSETGHNHVMERTHVTGFKPKDVKDADLYNLFFSVAQDTEITHLRDFDTHQPILVPPGNYEVRRQREYTPEGFRRAAD